MIKEFWLILNKETFELFENEIEKKDLFKTQFLKMIIFDFLQNKIKESQKSFLNLSRKDLK